MFFFFKQKTAYEMRISDWSSDVCSSDLMVRVGDGPGPRWGYNGNPESPTFTPSILVSYNGPDAGRNGAPPAICHSFVTDGRIQFLGDCTHALASQTVDLPEFKR